MNPRKAAALAVVIAVIVVAGCAGEAQEDNDLAAKLETADQLFREQAVPTLPAFSSRRSPSEAEGR